jgi:hypothetical protein
LWLIGFVAQQICEMTSLLFRPFGGTVAQYPGETCGEASPVSSEKCEIQLNSAWLVRFGQGILSRDGSPMRGCIGDAFGTESAEQAEISVSPLPHQVVSFSAPSGLEHLRSCTGSDTFNRCNLCLIKSTIGVWMRGSASTET